MKFSANGANMIQGAEWFAAAAHAAVNQRRKYTNDPYIVHPRAVAKIVQEVPKIVTWEMVAVAWLHDTVEDTKVTHELIREYFGVVVSDGVRDLTNVDPSFGNRATRFEANLYRLSGAPSWAQTIKLADLYDNTSSIVQHDPKFAPVYLREKRQTLEVLRDGDRGLWNMVHEQLEKSEAQLEAMSS